MSGTNLEEEVAAMLRRRAADINDETATGLALESPMVALGPAATSSRRRIPLALVASLAVALGALGFVVANRSPSPAETVTSGTEAAAAQPEPTPSPNSNDADPDASASNSLTAPASDPCPEDFPAGYDTTGDGEIDTCYQYPSQAFAQSTDESPVEEAEVEERTWLLPGPAWEVERFTSQVFGAAGPPAARTDFFAATDDGPFGETVWAYYLPGADYRRVGNPGGTYQDKTLSDGRIVRVRDDSRPVAVLAVFEAPGGAAVAIGYSVSDENLLEIIEGLQIEDGVVSWPGGPLPQGLSPVDIAPGPPFISSVSMSRGETEMLEVIQFESGQWQEVLNARVAHPDALTFFLPSPDQGYAYSYDPNSRDDPGAAFSHQGRFYLLRLPRWSPSDAYATEAEVLAIVENMIEIREQELTEDLGLQPRADVYQEWFDTTPLPDRQRLQWLLNGPAVDARQEAYSAHQYFACAWAGEWIDTGDTAAIEQLSTQFNWPTARLIAELSAELAAPSDGDNATADDPIAEEEPFFHTIEPGDVLATIATRYNVTVEAILNANEDLDRGPDLNLLRVGDLILIPGGATAPPLFLPGIQAEQLTPGDTPGERATPAIRRSCGFALTDLPPATE